MDKQLILTGTNNCLHFFVSISRTSFSFCQHRIISLRPARLANGRIPFQWDASANAGFTTGTAWINVNPDYTNVNEQLQNTDPNSVLNYFRKAIQLRKHNLVLVYGKYTLLDKDNPAAYAYTSELAGKKYWCWLIFITSQPLQKQVSIPVTQKTLLHNYLTPSKNGNLAPYEAIVYQLKP
jgi:oligo-1,6-glucosidase